MATRCARGGPEGYSPYKSNDGCRVLAQEMFTALLMQPVAKLGAAEANDDNQSDTCDITVADILGPLLEKESDTSAEVNNSDRARDANFSLLSYSFSLVGPSEDELRTKCSCNAAVPRLGCGCGQAQRWRAV